MVKRKTEVRLRKLSGQFPAVLILGPRQCGKTTLARHCVRGQYFDLEKPSDAQIFSDDIEFALRRLWGCSPTVMAAFSTLLHSAGRWESMLEYQVDRRPGSNG